jgi:hypothetical protein|tara:strand:- start:9852 stop:10253 length:402 start_codon:yes stop_codon:yes gene_type:complete
MSAWERCTKDWEFGTEYCGRPTLKWWVALEARLQGQIEVTSSPAILTLSGGLSYFVCPRLRVRRHCECEVFLANREIDNANARTNQDLWTACEGQSNKFGILTRLDLRAFPLGQMWSGKRFYLSVNFPLNYQA